MLRILIVEDSPVNMLLTVAILERAGHVALKAETAAEGLALARSQRPDLILMDIQLPDMDGLEATRLVRADPRISDVPIIALTAFAMKGDAEIMRDAGCDGYVTKPIRYQEFLQEVESVVERMQGRRQPQ
ncbi:response regulator [Rhizobacter sp. LjRoot28]|jgi:two-component system, cell cycle response regulator DivK|uniref:response regulator n=1 Tax=Rhizobacter sp. LjRoot28 TaxID=3342309 RepID=UPI003ED15D3E